MRIALVVPGGVDRSGERRVIPALLWLIERLGRAHDVRVFALRQERRPGNWWLNGAVIQNIGWPLTVPRAVAAIRREHARSRFDLVHCIWGGEVALAGVAAARSVGIPVLVHLAGGELAALRDIAYGGQLRWHRRVLDRWSLRHANGVTAASAPVIELAQKIGVEAHRVPLGVDLAAWPQEAPRPRARDERVRLIHVASLNRVKDQSTLLRAIRRLRDAQLDLQLDVVGDDTLEGAMQRLAAELRIADHVRFHGFRTQRELRPLMGSAHIHLVSSRHEAGPLALLEAAVAGVPTVGTAVGHLREWADGAAICTPVGDDAALAAGIRGLVADDGERVRVALEAQRRAVAEDADFTMRCFERLYREVVRNGRVRGAAAP
jgi:glycosyltransferase involved in cell wall biosynthesis